MEHPGINPHQCDKNEVSQKGKELAILVVDDEVGFRNLLKWELESCGMIVDTAENGVQALKIARQKHIDVVVTDVTMPEMNGIKFLEFLKKSMPRTQVIVVTGFGAIETAVYAMQQGASDFLLKPYDVQYLLTSIKKASQYVNHCRTCGRSNS